MTLFKDLPENIIKQNIEAISTSILLDELGSVLYYTNHKSLISNLVEVISILIILVNVYQVQYKVSTMTTKPMGASKPSVLLQSPSLFFLRLDLLHQIFIVLSYRSSTYFVIVVNWSGILIFRFGFPIASYVKMYLRGHLDQDGGVGRSWAQLPPLGTAKLQLHTGWKSWQWRDDTECILSN